MGHGIPSLRLGLFSELGVLINFRLAVSLTKTGHSHVTSWGWAWLGAG